MDDLGAILNSATPHPVDSIISGDFNVHFGNTQSTAALNLANMLDNAGFVQFRSRDLKIDIMKRSRVLKGSGIVIAASAIG